MAEWQIETLDHASTRVTAEVYTNSDGLVTFVGADDRTVLIIPTRCLLYAKRLD